MNATLSSTLIAASLLAAAGCLLVTLLDRPIGTPVLVALGVLEVGLLVQSVLGVVLLAGTERDVAAGAFVGYLVVILIVLPGAAVWAVAEPGRWGAGVLAIGCLVVPVLIVRLQQVWDPSVG